MKLLVFPFIVSLGCGDKDTTLRADAADDAAQDALVEAPNCTERPADAPETRSEVAGVFDEARNRILVYGGNTAAPVECMPDYEYVAELWAFHLDCHSWERIEAPGGPGIRARHSIVLDGSHDRLILFGGRERLGFGRYTYYNDVWALGLASDTWSEITTTGSAPSGRAVTAAAYDEARNRLIIFGGDVDTMGLLRAIGDMFALDLESGAWSAITTTGGPAARFYHSSSVLGDELIVFGGAAAFNPPYFNDAYAFNMVNDTWRRIATGSGPSPRFGSALFADSANRRVIAFGGHDDGDLGNHNDSWSLDLDGDGWTELHGGDTLNGAPSGPCMFPTDFTVPEETSPERRYSMMAVQSTSTGFVFGGKTDCGNINDVWAMDLPTGAWSQRRPATGGEACNRSGATQCTTLCY